MKRLVFILFVIPLFSSAQDLMQYNADTDEIFVDEVIEFPGVEKSELFSKTKLWMADMFKNINAVIKVEDKDIGIIQGNYITKYGPPEFSQDLEIKFKDGKIKFSISNIRNTQNGWKFSGWVIKNNGEWKSGSGEKNRQAFENNVSSMIASLKKSINTEESW